MNKIITVHQPESFCWLGLIDKISKADEFIVLDTCQFEKNYFQNRNKIKTRSGETFITIPIEKHNQKPIKDVLICSDKQWKYKTINIIKENYCKSINFDLHFHKIKEILLSPYDKLINYNIDFIRYTLNQFNIITPLIFASELGIDSNLKSTDLLIDICKKTNATTYLSGVSGVDYLEQYKFVSNNIKLIFHTFFHPIYKQLFNDFIPGLSCLDVLFNVKQSEYCNLLNNKGKNSIIEILSNIPDLKNKTVLEMFGGNGSGHLSAYANDINNLYIWELYQENISQLKNKFTNANILNVNSLEQVNIDKNKYDVIILDTPSQLKTECILIPALKLLNNRGFIIFRAIKKSYNQNSSISPDLSIEEWCSLIKSTGLNVVQYKEFIREYYYTNHWLSNYFFEVEKI